MRLEAGQALAALVGGFGESVARMPSGCRLAVMIVTAENR
jgi:hypothetical protein